MVKIIEFFGYCVGFPIVGEHAGGTPPTSYIFFRKPPPAPKPMPPHRAPSPPPSDLKMKPPLLKYETPFHEMIPRKNTINNNLESS